ncbi:MAG TPA: universal stress protein [Burkholderiaceae bacterium]|nr:universal stress protein [Burkholderiaceae bacterium]
MSYRSLLVLLDHTPACAARARCAIQLAKDLDGHLVGLAPTDLVDLPNAPKAAASLQEYAAKVWDALRDQAERAVDAFRAECHAGQLASFEAIVDEASKVDSLVSHARWADLTVLTQADPSEPNHAVAQDLVESVLLHSARPTLVLPYAAGPRRIGSRVMVAWNDTHEAARAVSDALPLLQRASHTEVVTWGERSGAHEKPLRTQLEALQKWLKWHGVTAAVRIERSGASIADSMLSHAADLDADLIVMGAYGHSRWTELVLGGATRGLLASMTVPVLMSH